MARWRLLSPRHRSEQYFTSSHTRSHFLRQRNGRPHCAHTFSGRSCFLRAAIGWEDRACVDEAGCKHVIAMSNAKRRLRLHAGYCWSTAVHGIGSKRTRFVMVCRKRFGGTSAASEGATLTATEYGLIPSPPASAFEARVRASLSLPSSCAHERF
ncbi:Hypothetical Protein XCAW_00061 [Xanthomonas citri subsp. citri Aw12879]|uniref:Uncharacterized protein n=1 Tax=Xanthomonas axonopodis pv. citri (strain 306) TaxID=190486 RepID=A0AAI7ZJ31_XANAC|nr:hypothetical protein XAC4234 [Xanthomonas citri pv. citri str. 306]AGI05890.1 Hypothetical Protein XCAW_00061 [Xanthomonas citri subsp. citri Aw12879]